MDYFKTLFFVLLILFSFHAFADSNDSNVGVSVKYYCDTAMPNFYAPGNGTIAKNSTGHFLAEMQNVGNYRSNITVNYLNVTRQNSSYEPGESQLGEVIKEYENQTYRNVSVGDYEYYLKTFNATYEEGTYAGHVSVTTFCNTTEANNESNSTQNFTFERHNKFEIVTAYGEQGGVNTTGNQTTNKTFPDEINDTGTEETNETLPQDADEFGETSDQTVEGDNDNPGQTPVPEPDPTPVPEPFLEIDIEPVNSTYEAEQGAFAATRMRIENVGTQEVEDLEVVPLIDEVRPDWNVRPAEIANLSVNETVERDVFIQPPEDQDPGSYVIPVVARNSERRVDLDYFTLEVKQSEFESKVGITEAPQSVSLEMNSSQNIPILVENTGRKPLRNVTARLQNIEDCGRLEASTIDSIEVNDSVSLDMTLTAGQQSQECNTTLIVSSAEGAYAFSNIQYSTTPPEGLIPREHEVPFVAIAWTVILMAYAVLRKKYNLTSSMVRIPFIVLLMGETVILMYMIVNYYGVMSVSFLPF